MEDLYNSMNKLKTVVHESLIKFVEQTKNSAVYGGFIN